MRMGLNHKPKKEEVAIRITTQPAIFTDRYFHSHLKMKLRAKTTRAKEIRKDCAAHFARVLELLKRFGVAYEEQPKLVRGLDYYTGTAFEVVAAGLGAQDAVAGGGRYNGLSQELGGPILPAIGFAIGEDRLLEVLPQDLGQGSGFKVFLAALGEPARDQAFHLMQELRQRRVAAEMDLEGRSLKAQMTQANRYGAAYAVILGDRELETGEAQLRRMADGEQEKVTLKDLTSLLAARAQETA